MRNGALTTIMHIWMSSMRNAGRQCLPVTCWERWETLAMRSLPLRICILEFMRIAGGLWIRGTILNPEQGLLRCFLVMNTRLKAICVPLARSGPYSGTTCRLVRWYGLLPPEPKGCGFVYRGIKGFRR